MKKTLRSDCPIAASLDILGDRWTMLILRDMLLGGKSQFGEFATEESVATNILADRLATLVERGIIERVPDEADRRKYTPNQRLRGAWGRLLRPYRLGQDRTPHLDFEGLHRVRLGRKPVA